MPRTSLLSLCFGIAILLTALPAQAGCWGYDDLGAAPCIAKYCSGQYEWITCGFGCTSGTCNPTGNSTLCCGKRVNYAQIFDDGGKSCGQCGNAPFRAHSGMEHSSPEHRAELLAGHTPGLIMFTANVSYKPTEFVYNISRCDHKLRLFVEDGRRVISGGM